MGDQGPEPNNPLSPYFPSEVPSLPTSGRRWVAILILLLVFSGIIAGVARWIFVLF